MNWDYIATMIMNGLWLLVLALIIIGIGAFVAFGIMSNTVIIDEVGIVEDIVNVYPGGFLSPPTCVYVVNGTKIISNCGFNEGDNICITNSETHLKCNKDNSRTAQWYKSLVKGSYNG